MMCKECGRDVLGYTAMGIEGPLPHGCPRELVYAYRDELKALRKIAETARDYVEDEDEDREATFDALFESVESWRGTTQAITTEKKR